MKGFETREKKKPKIKVTRKKDCPAMKGFETSDTTKPPKAYKKSKKDCPAMKGFET